LGIIYGIFCGKVFAAFHLAPSSLAFYSLIGVGCLGGLFGSVIKKPLTAVVLAVEVTSFSDLRVIAIIAVISYFTTGLIDRIDKKVTDKRKGINPGHGPESSSDSMPIKDLLDQDNLDIQDILDGTGDPNQQEEMYDS
jgi:H+/Cl- antiporter ClcA